MLNYHVKIGLVPIRRDCTPRPGIFNWEYAEDRARKTVAYIEEHFTSENVSFVDLKSINEVEVLYNEKDVQPVVDLMRKERANLYHQQQLRQRRGRRHGHQRAWSSGFALGPAGRRI